jgi:hypothetical protein
METRGRTGQNLGWAVRLDVLDIEMSGRRELIKSEDFLRTVADGGGEGSRGVLINRLKSMDSYS